MTSVPFLRLALIAMAVVTLGANEGGCRPKQRVGTQTCLACHDGRSGADKREFLEGLHAGIDCETCHGPGSLHVRNIGRGSFFIDNPARLPEPESSALCAECHAELTAGFRASAHPDNGVSCHDCHDVHKRGGLLDSSPNRALLTHAGYDRACSECHQPAVDDYALSRHFELPQLTCGVCHNMHEPDLFTADPVNNRLCLQCHQSQNLGFISDAVVDEHTGFMHPVDPAGSGASRCTKCHLPPQLPFNETLHDHTLATVPPSRTAEALNGSAALIPANSCAGVTGCHDPSVPGSGMPHDPFDAELNTALQGVYELLGRAPGAE